MVRRPSQFRSEQLTQEQYSREFDGLAGARSYYVLLLWLILRITEDTSEAACEPYQTRALELAMQIIDKCPEVIVPALERDPGGRLVVRVADGCTDYLFLNWANNFSWYMPGREPDNSFWRSVFPLS